jgi:hypothetical protein
MIIDIPHQNPIKQLNKGDLKGSIKETFNIDLSSKPDKICLPFKTRVSTTTDEESTLGLINQFLWGEKKWMALSAGQDFVGGAGGKLLVGSDSSDESFSLPTWTVNTTDFNTDAVAIAHKGEIVYMSDDIWALSDADDTSFTSRSTTGGNSFAIVFNGRVYFMASASQIEINSFESSNTPATSGSYTFTLPDSYSEVVGLDKTNELIWIATSSDEGKNAAVYTWDGVTEDVYTSMYEIPEANIMAIKVMDGIPYVVTGSGKLMAFNGSYFEVVAEFPFQNITLAGNSNFYLNIHDVLNGDNGRWIHHNGVDIVDGKLHFLINPIALENDTVFGDYSRLAGIWCYDPEIGLYHKYALSVLDSNGEQGIVKRVGALKATPVEIDSDANDYGKMIFSFSYYTEDNIDTNKFAIGFIENIPTSTLVSTGYITTNRIYSQNIQDTWEKVCLGFEDMNSADSIITKYRRIEKDAFNVDIVWTGDTTYLSNDANLATVKTNFDAGIGYESRILYGDGSGVISQITGITVNAGTYTITVDTAHNQTPTNTAVARLENWEKVDTITDADNNIQFKQIPIGKESNWIQYKFVLNGTETSLNKHNPVINRIVSVSNQHTKFQ